MPTEMTPERALIVLNQCNTDGRIKVDREELKQAVKMASEAIRRRIPMKPQMFETNIWDFKKEFRCPKCKATVGLVEENGTNWGHGKFCRECGQALDWSDYE